jgi:hypothetical protein
VSFLSLLKAFIQFSFRQTPVQDVVLKQGEFPAQSAEAVDVRRLGTNTKLRNVSVGQRRVVVHP